MIGGNNETLDSLFIYFLKYIPFMDSLKFMLLHGLYEGKSTIIFIFAMVCHYVSCASQRLILLAVYSWHYCGSVINVKA